MKPLGHLPYDRNHYYFPRTCEGFHVDRTHWTERHRDKIVFVVAVLIGLLMLIGVIQ